MSASSVPLYKNTSLALIDFNGERKDNRGVPAIKQAAQDNGYAPVTVFDARLKELPDINHYNVFVCTGGPGDPNDWGQHTGNADDDWGKRFFEFLDAVKAHNDSNPENPKFLFLICHSFQLASKHWKLGTLAKRDKPRLGVHEQIILENAKAAPHDYFRELKKPFYTLESRDYEVQPALPTEKGDFIPLTMDDRQALTSFCSLDGYIVGVQFHAEGTVAEAFRMLNDVTIKKNATVQEAITAAHGEDQLLVMRQLVDYLDTSNDIFKTFLLRAKEGRALKLTA